MQPLEFRAWDGKKMFKVTMLYLTKAGVKIGGGGYLQIEANKVKIMQASGLKDASNKQIFVGDILNYGGVSCPVIYDTKHANCGFVIQRPGDQVDMPLGIPYKKVIKVIGNIYETPELVK